MATPRDIVREAATRETREISNAEDVIDSRDVIARIEYLQGLGTAADWEERAELAALQSLATEAADYAADWEYGETLIRDTYFEDYARGLAEDIGAVPREYTWPMSHIDWPAAARALQQDYVSVNFAGVTYWIR